MRETIHEAPGLVIRNAGGYDFSGELRLSECFQIAFGDRAGAIAQEARDYLLNSPIPADYLQGFTYQGVSFYLKSPFELGTNPDDYIALDSFYVMVYLAGEGADEAADCQ